MHFKTKFHLLLTVIILFISQSACSGIKPEKLCQPNRLKIQMLGTRGPELWDKQASVSYLVWLDNKARIIIDAGPGSSQNFEASQAKFEDLDAILFSHFHVDHSADFMAYAKGGFFTERTRDLMIIGPSANQVFVSADQFVERAIGKKGVYSYLSNFVSEEQNSAFKIRPKTLPWTDDHPEVMTAYRNPATGLVVKAVATRHGPVPAFAYRVEAAGCSVVLSGDMSGQMGKVPAFARNAEILVAHNAVPEDASGVALKLHMKPSYIGKMAARANVKQLLLTHLMRRTADKSKTLTIIRKFYNGKVVFPEDMDIYFAE